MPFVHKRLRARIVHVIATEAITNEDVVSLRERLRSDPLLAGDTVDLLVDLRRVKDIELATTDIHRMARIHTGSKVRRLAVVAELDVVFGIARMYQSLRDPSLSQLEVFRDLGPALDWLEAPASEQQVG